MRLTLRTLLAYLDDLLEPQQARALGDRISRSEEAAGMVSRIRNVLRKRRVEAPDVDSESVEANVVAGYLDNQLEAADVEAFERKALNDDVVLAEAAGTHQILSVVLGEPIAVPPDLRMRMYGLAGMDAAAPPTEQPAVPVVGRQSSAMFKLDDPPPAPKPDETASKWPIAAGLALVGLWVAMLAYYVSNTGADREARVAGVDRDVAPPVVVDEDEASAGESDVAAADVDAVAATDAASDAASDATATDDAMPDMSDPAKEAAPEVAAFDLAMQDAAADGTEGSAAVSDAVGETAEDPLRPIDVASIFSQPLDESDAMPKAADAPDPADAIAMAKPADSAPQPSAMDAVEEVVELAADPKPVEPVARKPFAYQYVTADGVAIQQAADSADWERLPPRSIVFDGEVIVVPPLFTARFAISDDDTPVGELALFGPASARIDKPTPATKGGLTLARGRASLSWTEADEPRSVTLSNGSDVRVATLGEVGGRLLLTASQPVPAGKIDPPLKPVELSLNVVDGTVSLDAQPFAPAVELDAGQSVSVLRDTVPEDAATPTWASGGGESLIDRRYRATFFEAFPETGLSERLAAMEADPRFRISEMATETLALIGDVKAVVNGLIAEHSETRRTAIDETRRFLATEADAEKTIRETLQRSLRSDDVDTAMRLLVGFDKDKLRSQALSAQMVEWLRSDSLPVRELALAQLRRHGLRTYDYQPDDSLAQRNSALRRVEDRLRSQKSLVQPPLEDDAGGINLDFPIGP